MPDQTLRVAGGLVAEVEAALPRSYTRETGGRLFLFREPGRGWSLLEVRHATQRDEYDRILEGHASADVASYPDLEALKAAFEHWGRTEDWRELVKAGARRDAELNTLWVPVQIDTDLRRGSVDRRDLGVPGAAEQPGSRRRAALELALARLRELGYVVLDADTDVSRIVPRLRRWPNPVVGGARIAQYGHRVQVVIAMDGAGEIYTRTPDTNFDPGERRRYPPRPLTETEARRVEKEYSRYRAEQLRRLEEERER